MIVQKKQVPQTLMRRLGGWVAVSLCAPALLFAATGPSVPGTDTALAVTAAVTLFMIVLLFYVILVLNGDISSIVNLVRRMKNYVVPSAEEDAPALDDEFDGIRELDNRVPPWFNYLFYGSMVFAAAYLMNFHILKSSKLSFGEYQDELAAAALQRQIMIASQGSIDESKLVALKNPADLKAGMENFKKYCVSCHGPEAGGVVGPNLTDQYWIHGGGIKNVYTTIKMGVPAKGMISWQLVFSPKQIQELASYVLSLQGTNPVGGKAPQGALWVEKDSTAIAAKTDSVTVKKAL
ncbi:MAG TPA: cbb3-type cytochrome c oxidase N-terminal domain-containing protein [Bacteroidota bacterium]|nr:cbb3-type cytochrome c oxidase N-terminal domain-containing protein [Bacteroidota bacterium]